MLFKLKQQILKLHVLYDLIAEKKYYVHIEKKWKNKQMKTIFWC